MDHLVVLPSSTFALPSIVYPGSEYTPNESQTFHESLELVFNVAFSTRTDHSVARLAALLYFGLLHEVLGSVEQEKYILRRQDGASILTTKHFEMDVRNWLKRLKKMKKQERKEALVGAYDKMNWTQIVVDGEAYEQKTAAMFDVEFICAIQVLGSSLAAVMHNFAQENGMIAKDSPAELYVCWSPKTAWATQKMLANGWCPYEVERFARVLTPLTQIFALGLRTSPNALDHSDCTPLICTANNVSGEYIPTHTDHCRSPQPCIFEDSHIEEVVRILCEGGLPLIEIRRNKDGSLTLRAVKYRYGRRYVAISHVWSDGMGNKNKNEMRTCQLIRIWEKARLLLRDNSQITLSSDNRVNLFVLGYSLLEHSTRNLLDFDTAAVTIWMDTLCIPLEPYEVRSLAIKGMRGAYEKGSDSIRIP
jgi:hypothetical protein